MDSYLLHYVRQIAEAIRCKRITVANGEPDAALFELGAATEGCLAALPDARRIAVGMHLTGFAAGEIALAMSWGEKRVRNLLHRGLAALRQCLAGKGFGR